MRKKKVEGKYQIDSWPKGPEWSLCPLARPDIAMGLESQIEAWSAHRSRSLKTSVSHCQFVSIVRKTATVSTSETTSHRLRVEKPAERRGGLGCQGQRHRGRRRCTLDIPLHRRDLWAAPLGMTSRTPCDLWDSSAPEKKNARPHPRSGD
jgi:hypothetical protein